MPQPDRPKRKLGQGKIYTVKARVTKEDRRAFWDVCHNIEKSESEALREAMQEYIIKKKNLLARTDKHST